MSAEIIVLPFVFLFNALVMFVRSIPSLLLALLCMLIFTPSGLIVFAALAILVMFLCL